MRLMAVVFTAVIVLGTLASPALGSHDGTHHVQNDIESFTGRSGGGGGGGTDNGAGRNRGGGTARPVINSEPVYNVGLGELGDGDGGTTRCWRIEVGGSQTLADAREMLNDFDDNGTLYDACPRQQRVPTLAERIQAQFERWSPAPTTAEIAPGYALTGLKGFLVIDDPSPASITLVGQTVTLRKAYRIRWGDGSSTTTTSSGVPHPGGESEITHIYRNAGTVAVEIDLVVSGSWNGRDLGSLAPVTTVMPLEVWQVQAVRQR